MKEKYGAALGGACRFGPLLLDLQKKEKPLQGFIQGGYRGYIVPPEDFSRFFFEKCTPCQGVHFVFWEYIGGTVLYHM